MEVMMAEKWTSVTTVHSLLKAAEPLECGVVVATEGKEGANKSWRTSYPEMKAEEDVWATRLRDNRYRLHIRPQL